ncbi:MAG: UvrD/REP helicase, partial [Synergistales bacterium 54_9]
MKEAGSTLLSSLNPEQSEAVRYTDGPMLVLAGAGSGKTRVLTYKYAYLVLEKGLSPSQILAVTFTNKAARQMRDRVMKLLQTETYRMDVSTFHAYGLKFLSRYDKEVKAVLKRQVKVVFDRGDTKTVIRKILKEMSLDPQKVDPRWVLEEISRCKRDVSPPTFEFRKLDAPLGQVFEKYEKLLKEQHAVDFDDLLVLPLKALSTDPELRKNERSRYKWILVDEYQDVNRTQYHLLKMLAGPSGKVMVVGDPDQSIYGWRGADMSMIMNFEKDYPNAKVFLLERNYRSTETILTAANAVIRNNRNRREKTLWTERDKGSPVRVVLMGNEHEEAEFISQEIRNLRNLGYKYKDMAVLYRINAMSRL